MERKREREGQDPKRHQMHASKRASAKNHGHMAGYIQTLGARNKKLHTKKVHHKKPRHPLWRLKMVHPYL